MLTAGQSGECLDPLPSSRSVFGWKPRHAQRGKVNIPVEALTSL